MAVMLENFVGTISTRLAPTNRPSSPITVPTVPVEQQPAQSVLGNQQSKFDLLKEAKELLDAGVLTQEEFDAKKKEILRTVC